MHSASAPVRHLLLSIATFALSACITDNPATADDAALGDMQVDMAVADAAPPNCETQVELDRARIDFAPTEAFETRSERIRVTNTGACPITLNAVLLNGARAFALRLNGVDIARDVAPLVDPDADGTPGLSAGASFELEVQFTPPDESAKAGEVSLVFDDDDIRIPLTGNQAGPCFVVDPPVLEFTTGLNQAQTAEISVTSCGSEPITIQSAVFSEDSDAAFTLVAERSTALPFALAPADSAGGTTLSLTIRFAPDQLGTANSRLVIEAQDAPTQEIRLVGRAQQNACPVAVFPPEPIIAEVGEAVVLDGSASLDPDGPDGRPVEWEWVVVGQPEGSTAQPVEALFDADNPINGGPADDAETPEAVFVPGVAGQYTLELRVVDVDGLTSIECETNATVVIRVGFERRVVVQLTWVTPGDLDLNDAEGADVDVRLSNSVGEVCSPAEPTPDWLPEGPANDPVYDTDAQAGPGPENIILTQPTDARYGVAVFYDDDAGLGQSIATVRVFVNDRLTQTEVFPLFETGDAGGFEFMLP